MLSAFDGVYKTIHIYKQLDQFNETKSKSGIIIFICTQHMRFHTFSSLAISFSMQYVSYVPKHKHFVLEFLVIKIQSKLEPETHFY